METKEKLYSDVPPTQLRGKEEKFKPAKTSKFWLTVASLFFFNMLQNRFYAFRYNGFENYANRDKTVPTILFAPHSNWWDGIVLYNTTHRICKKEIRLMVEELNRFPLLRRGGAYSVNKKSPQSAMQALKYSVDLLKDFQNFLKKKEEVLKTCGILYIIAQLVEGGKSLIDDSKAADIAKKCNCKFEKIKDYKEIDSIFNKAIRESLSN
jgi:1-acyl-sn-glycerol-3-phosphate acyltransferase